MAASAIAIIIRSPPQPVVNEGILSSRSTIYGSEIGAWEVDGGPAVHDSTIRGLITSAGIPDIRFAMYDCFTGETCGRDHHPGSETRTNLDSAIVGITQTLHAVPWIELLPITSGVIGSVSNGSVFCPPWTGDATGNLGMYEDQLRQIAQVYRGPIILESSNEMENDCWRTWQAQGAPIASAGSPGVSQRLGEVYAATMPALKAYATALHFSQVVTVGYIGVGGGTRWGQPCTADRSAAYGYSCGYQERWIDEFNTAVYAAYVASGDNPDYVPDAESIHAYPHSSDFSASPGYEFDDNVAFAYYRQWIESSRDAVDAIWGSSPGDNIRFAISEWNAGVANASGAWSGWRSPSRVQTFYAGWFNMLAGDGMSTGQGTRFWAANCFELASNADTGAGAPYNLVEQDGTTPAWYATFVRSRHRSRA